MREVIIAGNWKMNGLKSDLENYFTKFLPLVNMVERIKIIIIPPYTILNIASTYKRSNIEIGAQNCFYEKKGAFTGEISPGMLIDSGCEYVILGHSERRQYIKESDEIILKKAKLVLRIGITPIICVGETLSEKESGETSNIIEKQVKGCFENISIDEVKKVIIAYEPVWAIGTGKVASPSDACEVIKLIRKLLKEKYNEEISENISILYGGSVKIENTESLMAEDEIDGALVGGASLNPVEFAEIVKIAEKVKYK